LPGDPRADTIPRQVVFLFWFFFEKFWFLWVFCAVWIGINCGLLFLLWV
jgi:hypothetical protein